jgi:muramoyltetrapeptide carboxypeptidase
LPSLLKPRALRPGATLGVAAPGFAVDPASLAEGLALWREAGFHVQHREDLCARDGYLAGDDARRLGELKALVADRRVDAILCARGGYGCDRILHRLDPARFRAARKPLIGYSDITALLDAFAGRAGLVSVHGPMAEGRLARGAIAFDPDSFLRIVCEPVPFGTIAAPQARTLQPGEARGVLRGGTLTQIAALLGTPWAFVAAEPTILFVDDVNERPYRLDRLLWQLRAAGVFDGVSGVVLNELPGCDEPDGSVTALDAVRHALAGFDGPIVAGVPSGHTAGVMITLPIGVQVTLHAGTDVSLSIDEPAVA